MFDSIILAGDRENLETCTLNGRHLCLAETEGASEAAHLELELVQSAVLDLHFPNDPAPRTARVTSRHQLFGHGNKPV